MDTLINMLEYLCQRYNLTIIIKDFTYRIFNSPPFSELRDKYYTHKNDYCSLIKSKRSAYKHCAQTSHSRILKKINESADPTASFWGVCYGGVKEYVIPLFYDEIPIGALIVGSFPCDQERAESSFNRLNKKFGFDVDQLKKAYENSFFSQQCDDEILLYELKLCAICLQYLIKEHIDISVVKAFLAKGLLNEKRYLLLNNAIEYIKNNISRKITIEDIAYFCYCSKSTLSHHFGELLGMGVAEYITKERLSYAKKLLRDTNLPVSQISEMCGFCSPTYFSNVFKRKENITPLEYRQGFLSNKSSQKSSDIK